MSSEEKNSLKKFSYSKLSTIDTSHGGCKWKYKLIYEDNYFINAPAVATDFGTLIHFIEEMMGKDLITHNGDKSFSLDYIKFTNLLLDGYHSCEAVGTYSQEEADEYNKKHNLSESDEKFKTSESIKYKIENIAGVKELKEKYPEDWFKKDKNGYTYADKVANYLSRGIYRLRDYLMANPDLEVVGLEQEFNLEYNGYLFHGFIDRVFRDQATGQIFIEDIKTWSKEADSKDLKTPLQFVFYTLAAKEIYGTDLITCAYELPLIGAKQCAGSKGYIDRGIKKIDQLLEEVEKKDFEPNPSPLCHWCVFSGTYPNQPAEAKGLCPYYSHWTKENKDFSVENEWMGMKNHPLIVEAYMKKINTPTQQSKRDIIIEQPITIPSDRERRFILRR